MLFDVPKSIITTNQQSYFQVEDEHLFISDPFEPSSIQLLGARILIEDIYHPFLYLKSRYEGYNSLVIFVCRDGSQLIAWKVNHKVPIDFVSQFPFPTSDLKFLFCLTESPLTKIKETIQRSATNSPEWARDALYAIAINLSDFSGVEECLSGSKEYLQLPQTIFYPYICTVNNSINSLINFIFTSLSDSDSSQIIHLFNTFNNRLGIDFVTDYSQLAKYCILRELVCVVTGRHVVMDPFTWEHVLSDCTALCSTTYYDKYPFEKSRLIKYKSTLGHYFIERRGPGWLDVTSSIILPNGFLIEI